MEYRQKPKVLPILVQFGQFAAARIMDVIRIRCIFRWM